MEPLAASVPPCRPLPSPGRPWPARRGSPEGPAESGAPCSAEGSKRQGPVVDYSPRGSLQLLSGTVTEPNAGGWLAEIARGDTAALQRLHQCFPPRLLGDMGQL